MTTIATTSVPQDDDNLPLTAEEEAELAELDVILPIADELIDQTLIPAMETYADEVDAANTVLAEKLSALDEEADKIMEDGRAEIEKGAQEEARQVLLDAE